MQLKNDEFSMPSPAIAPVAPLVSLAFYQPDIPQNVGAAMRLAACLDVPLHIIEPTSFPWKEAEFRRSGMDYVNHVDLVKHTSWDAFRTVKGPARTILV